MTREHWDAVYNRGAANALSWYQPKARRSLDLIRRAAPTFDRPIIDVGGGASTLVDGLLADGYTDVTVLDVSAAALTIARQRLGRISERVHWLNADVLEPTLPAGRFAVWHDRAVFHFLTQPDDRQRYLARVRDALRPGGHAIVATFAADGPARCSGLEVVRYSPEALHNEFGPGFGLNAREREEHITPSGAMQAFTYCVFEWTGEPSVRGCLA
ncbi:MAG: class I SAM-dependent methyltransferase [Gemmatimonadales bacterium]